MYVPLYSVKLCILLFLLGWAFSFEMCVCAGIGFACLSVFKF